MELTKCQAEQLAEALGVSVDEAMFCSNSYDLSFFTEAIIDLRNKLQQRELNRSIEVEALQTTIRTLASMLDVPCETKD